jgi:zinc/manganese transport system substrate-binding protein
VAALLLVACGGHDAAAAPKGECPTVPVRVVVSVSQWGDIAGDLGGACASVTTIVHGTAVDPHDYEPTPADLAAFTKADLVVVNGVNYDTWAVKAADSVSPKPVVVDAGTVVGKRAGDNPHLWYGPDYVNSVALAITAQLEALAPAGSAYFDERATAWRTAMQPYYDEVSALGADIAGNATYSATEPVFDYMAKAVGLVDRTPSGYRRAAANAVDPSPADLHDFQRELSDGSVGVLIVNEQTSGAVPDQLRSAAKRAGVAIVGVTEAPPNDTTFEAWQLSQLAALAKVLAQP